MESVHNIAHLARQHHNAAFIVCYGKLYESADLRIVKRFEFDEMLCSQCKLNRFYFFRFQPRILIGRKSLYK